ncbi:hypothetical protein [Thermobifida halotolerans]|uniref:hypothetical protein n=1 Tax=Thermobifida halotolerans TaxID=483545 RepID=UPI00373FC9B3
MQHPLLCTEFDQLDAEMFTVEQHRSVFRLVQEQGGVAAVEDPARWAGQLREAARTDAQRAFLTQLAVEPIEVYGELDEHRAQEIIGTIRIHSINRQITNLKSRLGRLDPMAEAEEYQRVFAELMAVEQRKRMMRERFGGAV